MSSGYSWPPDPPDQPLLGQHLAGVVRELLEQPVLGRGQPDRTSGHRHAMFGVVDRQLLQDEGFGLLVDQGGCIGLSLDRVDQVVDQVVSTGQPAGRLRGTSCGLSAGPGVGVLPSAIDVDPLMASGGVWR